MLHAFVYIFEEFKRKSKLKEHLSIGGLAEG
jgi:hypothetical protein